MKKIVCDKCGKDFPFLTSQEYLWVSDHEYANERIGIILKFTKIARDYQLNPMDADICPECARKYAEKRKEITQEEHIQASKNIGWEQ